MSVFRHRPKFPDPEHVRYFLLKLLGTGKKVTKEPSAPQLRFIQFLRKYDTRRRLGAVSRDGQYLVELSGGPCISHDFLAFLNQGFSVQEMERKIHTLPPERMTDNIKLLPPICNPEKIICVGLNYKSHCDEQKKEVPKEPMFFSKFTNAIIGPRCNVVAHDCTKRMDWEVELGVVIGKLCRNVEPNVAMDYVFGYTIAQDISARDWQKRNGGQFLLGKSMDTFCPIGPTVVHKSLINDPHKLYLKCAVNGIQKQNGNTSDLVFKIPQLISRLSQFITLNPGDIILTGTPKGVGMYRTPPEYLQVGDIIESEIQCIGRLCNRVIAPTQ